jgi:hypothetical protein
MHLWSRMAGPMGDPWSVGRDRVRTGAGWPIVSERGCRALGGQLPVS